MLFAVLPLSVSHYPETNIQKISGFADGVKPRKFAGPCSKRGLDQWSGLLPRSLAAIVLSTWEPTMTPFASCGTELTRMRGREECRQILSCASHGLPRRNCYLQPGVVHRINASPAFCAGLLSPFSTSSSRRRVSLVSPGRAKQIGLMPCREAAQGLLLQ